MSRLPPLAVTLRPLQDADLPGLADMWVESWRDVFPDIDFDARRAWFAARMAAHRSDGAHVIAAASADALAGFITLNAATHFIDQLAVSRAALGRGVARALVAEGRRLSPQRLLLDVNEANTRALRFYARQGFAVIGDGVSEASGLRLLRLRWEENTAGGRAAALMPEGRFPGSSPLDGPHPVRLLPAPE